MVVEAEAVVVVEALAGGDGRLAWNEVVDWTDRMRAGVVAGADAAVVVVVLGTAACRQRHGLVRRLVSTFISRIRRLV